MGCSVLTRSGRQSGPVCLLLIVLSALLCSVPCPAEAQVSSSFLFPWNKPPPPPPVVPATPPPPPEVPATPTPVACQTKGRNFVVEAVTSVPNDNTGNFSTHIKRPEGTVKLNWTITEVNFTVNGTTKSIPTVNGLFPGPTIYANEGDRIIINITNNLPPADIGQNDTIARNDVTIHFHGTRQERSPWMDGVAYVSMCPIQPNDYFVHNFTIPRQKGTLLWHAHIGWMRATLHGAFITSSDETPEYVKCLENSTRDYTMIFAEWWDKDIQRLEHSQILRGEPFPEPDAFLINGKPGPRYVNSTNQSTTTLYVQPNTTYLLRLINAAINNHMFFGVAGHRLTVVAADGEYVQPFIADHAFLSPGQTVDVLLSCDQAEGRYYMGTSDYGRGNHIVPNATALLIYNTTAGSENENTLLISPRLPIKNATDHFEVFMNSLRTINRGRVPLNVDTNLFFTVGLNSRLCNNGNTSRDDNCTNTNDGEEFYGWSGNVNNVTFPTEPTKVDLMQAMWYNIPGVYEEEFPRTPRPVWNYLGLNANKIPWRQRVAEVGARVIAIEFNSTVQIILQNTNLLGVENHPFHLHGHNFYILAQGYGNYDGDHDSHQFNLWDPPLRNTVSVPRGGWAAIRWKANNPGMWLFHCHLDKHASWGMMAVFNVHNATVDKAKYAMEAPPARLMPCRPLET